MCCDVAVVRGCVASSYEQKITVGVMLHNEIVPPASYIKTVCLQFCQCRLLFLWKDLVYDPSLL